MLLLVHQLLGLGQEGGHRAPSCGIHLQFCLILFPESYFSLTLQNPFLVRKTESNVEMGASETSMSHRSAPWVLPTCQQWDSPRSLGPLNHIIVKSLWLSCFSFHIVPLRHTTLWKHCCRKLTLLFWVSYCFPTDRSRDIPLRLTYFPSASFDQKIIFP